MTEWQPQGLDNVNPEECIDALGDFLKQGLGLWIIYKEFSEEQYCLVYSPSMKYTIYGDRGNDYRISNEENVWKKDVVVKKITRPLVAYEIMSYLLKKLNRKWVIWISR